MRGAEAVIRITRMIGMKAVSKRRVRKGYRASELDSRLRSERTRAEARLLNRAKGAGVSCPVVLKVGEAEIIMGHIEGRRPAMDARESAGAGRLLARLHAADIIHGDFTPANLIVNREGMHVIDFGLGFVSGDIEDRAVDVFTMLRTLKGEAQRNAFLDGYSSYGKAPAVRKRLKGVEMRVRYAQ